MHPTDTVEDDNVDADENRDQKQDIEHLAGSGLRLKNHLVQLGFPWSLGAV